MTVQIQLRRGTAANWTTNGTVVLAAGEPGFETDTGKFKVGDGTTQWASLPYAGGLESIRLQDLSDVASTSPSSGQVLKWNGSAWAPAADSTGGGGGGTTYTISAETTTGGANLRLTGSDLSTDNVKLAAGSNITVTRTDDSTITIAATGGGGGAANLGDLGDVNLTTPPTNGQVLKYNSGSSKWEPAADLTGGGGGSNQLTNGSFDTTLNNQGRLELGPDAATSSRLHAAGSYPWILAGSDNSGGPELSWMDIPVNSNTGTASGEIGNAATTLNTLYVDSNGVTIINDANDTYKQWVFNPNGTTSFPGFTLPATDGSPGQVLQTDGGGNVSWASAGGGGGGGLVSRDTATGTAALLGASASADVNITGGAKTYALLKIQVNEAAWVRIYTDAASRTADASRAEGVDPTPGAGVIAEIITTGAQTILMSPAAIGFSNETVPTTDIPVRVTNKSGSTADITVTLTFVQLEA